METKNTFTITTTVVENNSYNNSDDSYTISTTKSRLDVKDIIHMFACSMIHMTFLPETVYQAIAGYVVEYNGYCGDKTKHVDMDYISREEMEEENMEEENIEEENA